MKALTFTPVLLGTLMVTAIAEEASSVATITSPAAEQAIASDSQVTVKLHAEGYPVVAVRAKEKNCPWWIQQIAKSVGPQEFVLTSRFGNESTPNRTRFEVAAFVVPDLDTAESMKLGTTMKELPKGYPHSESVELILDRTEALGPAATLKADLLTPLPNKTAERLQKVSVRIPDVGDVVPLVLVRSIERNSPWWVQDPLRPQADGTLSGLVRIGNDKTPPGSAFFLVFALPNDASIQTLLPPGTSLKELSGFQRSQVFTVTTAGAEVNVPQNPTGQS